MVTLTIVVGLIALLIKYSVEMGPYNSLILRVLGTGLVGVWFNIYERNRFWIEVTNERARDIEREFGGRDGLGISFACAAIARKVVLKNKDASGVTIENKKEKTIRPVSIGNMHFWVWMLSAMIVFVLWAAGYGYELKIHIRVAIALFLMTPYILKGFILWLIGLFQRGRA